MQLKYAHSLLCLGLLLSASALSAVDKYALQPIALPNSANCAVPAATVDSNTFFLNDQGQVAGPLGGCAFFWQQGSATILGAQQTNNVTRVAGLNAKGQLIFNTSYYGVDGQIQANHAFFWEQGRSRELGKLSTQNYTVANGLNNQGQVVGTGATAQQDANGNILSHAFLWHNGTMQDVVAGTPYAAYGSAAQGINDNAQIVLNSGFDPTPKVVHDTVTNTLTIVKPGNIENSRPLLWQQGKLLELGYNTYQIRQPGSEQPFEYDGINYGILKELVISNVFYGRTWAINNAGIALGSVRKYSLTEDGAYYSSALWSTDGRLHPLTNGISYGPPVFKSKLNNANQVASILNACCYNRIAIALDGLSYAYGKASSALSSFSLVDMNDQGQVIWSENGYQGPTPYKAFLYQDNTVFELPELIPVTNEWVIGQAHAINNKGQIVVSGTWQGAQRYALLTPLSSWQWTAGLTSSQQPSKATFAGGATLNQGATLVSNFAATQTAAVIASMRPAPEHLGQSGVTYIVVAYNKTWFMKNAQGQWLNWDGKLAHLVPSSVAHVLKAQEKLVIEPKLHGLAGQFAVFIGYKVNVNIHYNAQPFSFSVTMP